MTTFAETVEAIQGKTGTRGFGAKKRTAAELISSEMKDIGPLSGIAGQILSDLAVETAKIEQATDPEELKDIGKRIREFKGIINQTQKNLSDDSKMSEEQLTALRKVINASDKNIKRAGRG